MPVARTGSDEAALGDARAHYVLILTPTQMLQPAVRSGLRPSFTQLEYFSTGVTTLPALLPRRGRESVRDEFSACFGESLHLPCTPCDRIRGEVLLV